VKVLSTLPPYVLLSQVFHESSSIAYKLNGMVVFTGQHYMILIRVRVSGSRDKIWTLFNDDKQTKRFE
jgi:hypothetical protein